MSGSEPLRLGWKNLLKATTTAFQLAAADIQPYKDRFEAAKALWVEVRPSSAPLLSQQQRHHSVLQAKNMQQHSAATADVIQRGFDVPDGTTILHCVPSYRQPLMRAGIADLCLDVQWSKDC